MGWPAAPARQRHLDFPQNIFCGAFQRKAPQGKMGNASRGGRPIDGKRTLRGGPPDCFRSSPSPLRFLFFGSFFSFSERKERTDLFPKEKERTEKTHSTSSGPVERESSTAMRFSGQRPSAVSLASSALIMLPESREEIVMAMLCSACSNRSSQSCVGGAGCSRRRNYSSITVL